MRSVVSNYNKVEVFQLREGGKGAREVITASKDRSYSIKNDWDSRRSFRSSASSVNSQLSPTKGDWLVWYEKRGATHFSDQTYATLGDAKRAMRAIRATGVLNVWCKRGEKA